MVEMVDLRHDHHGCRLCKRQRAEAADEIERLEAENADLRSRTSSTLPAAVKSAASALIGRIDRGVPAGGLEACVEVVARWCLDERAEP